jgi:hypothetical protein
VPKIQVLQQATNSARAVVVIHFQLSGLSADGAEPELLYPQVVVLIERDPVS